MNWIGYKLIVFWLFSCIVTSAADSSKFAIFADLSQLITILLLYHTQDLVIVKLSRALVARWLVCVIIVISKPDGRHLRWRGSSNWSPTDLVAHKTGSSRVPGGQLECSSYSSWSKMLGLGEFSEAINKTRRLVSHKATLAKMTQEGESSALLTGYIVQVRWCWFQWWYRPGVVVGSVHWGSQFHWHVNMPKADEVDNSPITRREMLGYCSLG